MVPKHIDVADAGWRKASRSVNNGQCVEVGAARADIVVRDSADSSGSMLSYPVASWQLFLAAAKRGAYDAVR